MRIDRMRRHMLNIGPPPRYRASRLIAKERSHIDGEKFMRAWQKAVGDRGPATVSMVEVDADYIRLTIAFDEQEKTK